MQFGNSQDNHIQGYASVADATRTTVIAAQPGWQFVIVSLAIFNAHATTGTGVELGSNANKIWGPIPAPGGKLGATVNLTEPIVCNEGEAFTFIPLDAVDAIHVSASGYRKRA